MAIRDFHRQSHMAIWWLGLVRSRDKVKTYFQYHSAYCHQSLHAVTYLKGLLPISYPTLLLLGLARSREKLNPLYLRYPNAYGHQTWQGDDLPRETPTYKVTQPFDLVTLQIHVID